MVFENFLETQILNILQFAVVIAIGLLITKIVTDMISRFLKSPEIKKIISKMGYETPIIEFVVLVVRYVLYFITVIVALAQFGFANFVFDVIIVLIALFIVVLILFGLKDFVPNASAGIYLNIVKSIRKGDLLRIGGYSGKVVDMDLVSITIQDNSGRLIIIPNSNVIKKDIIKEMPKKHKK